MNLTKEQCLYNLKALITRGGNEDEFLRLYPHLKYEIDYIFKLIDEHFDNPPLKPEELKEGMWLWDNQQKEYIKINRLKMVISDMNNYGYYIYPTYWTIPIEFEENRFYRKRVEE